MSTIYHTRLTETDAASIRSFLRAYEQYSKYIQQRAKQVHAMMSISSEAVTQGNINFF